MKKAVTVRHQNLFFFEKPNQLYIHYSQLYIVNYCQTVQTVLKKHQPYINYRQLSLVNYCQNCSSWWFQPN